MVAVVLLSLLMPGNLAAGPGWFAVGIVTALAIAGLLVERWHVWLGHSAAAIATGELALSLAALVKDLTAHHGHPVEILRGALLLWSMNVIIFAAWYWRLDAGGPHRRSRQEVYCGGAFLFPYLTLSKERCHELGVSDWRPRFIDYLFLAFNTSTAFSPTDVPVLSAWAKVLMMTQASISLVTLAMVAARAVNIL